MYALVDCNNFYASCERVFDPKLEKKPVVILSNNDGCIIARSEEAKKAGIAMGAPPHMIPELLRKHKVQIFSSNYTLYGDMSDRVMKTLATFVPRMEIYSIDEAFLDMHQMPHTNLLQLGLNIRRTIRQHTGIPVCVGIAATKTLAKMANRFAKKMHSNAGVYWAADKAQVNEMLSHTAVGDIWGIGHQRTLLLQKNGFKTALDLTRASDDWIRNHMSVVGLRTINELRGIAALDWEFEQPPKKNICTGRSFGILTNDKDLIREAISNYAASCALKLREQKSAAGELRVFLHTNPFRPQDKQYFRSVVVQLPLASNSTPTIIHYVLKGLNLIFKPGYQYHKCGVELRNLVPENETQLNLFDSNSPAKMKAAVAALDKVNGALGKETVRFGVQGFKKSYKARAASVSPCYTTDISQVIKIQH